MISKVRANTNNPVFNPDSRFSAMEAATAGHLEWTSGKGWPLDTGGNRATDF